MAIFKKNGHRRVREKFRNELTDEVAARGIGPEQRCTDDQSGPEQKILT